MLAEKVPCRWGRATLMIELSSTSRVVPSITAIAINHLCDIACGASIRLMVLGAAIDLRLRPLLPVAG